MATGTGRKLLGLALLGITLAVVACLGVAGPCWSAWAFDGVWLGRCPTGVVRWRPSVEVRGLGRDRPGTVTVWVDGHYVPGGRDTAAITPVTRFRLDAVWVDPDGKEIELDPERGWSRDGARRVARVPAPEGPDGDWTLRVTVRRARHVETVEVEVPIYVPALGHVLTDAPLYRPGQEVRMRAVVFGQDDLRPLEGRPGRWYVIDPEGEVLFEERARAGPLGVAATTFPIDAAAPTGTWTVRFRSGATTVDRPIEVREFQLPRFVVDTKSERRWYGRGDVPVVTGTVRYTSGAPVRGAPVTVQAAAAGDWPVPLAWTETRTLTTGPDGSFRFELERVPEDLQKSATLTWRLTAVDETGDTATGAVTLRFAADAIAADTVTELADGLVAGANNRLYVRATRPDGEVLRGATLTLRRAWDPTDPGVEAVADGDGVARFQVDPREPITVVEPPMPVRERPTAAARVEVAAAEDILRGEAVDVDGRAVLDRWSAALRTCLPYAPPGEEGVALAVHAVLRGGRVTLARASASGEDAPLGACVERALIGLAGPPGDRVWRVDLRLSDPLSPYLELQALRSGAGGAETALRAALRAARPCVALEGTPTAHPRAWFWTVDAGAKAPRLTALDAPGTAGRLAAGPAACVETALGRATLERPADAAAEGVFTVSVRVPRAASPRTEPPLTYPGFEYHLTARMGDQELGSTTLRLKPGTVPPLRVRVPEVIVDPGAEVAVSLLRGPDWVGEVPRKVFLRRDAKKLAECEVKGDAGGCTLEVPTDARGFLQVDAGQASAVLLVRADDRLEVRLSPDREVYRPGEVARLTVSTRGATGPVPAGVTLAGVDRAMSALIPLDAPDQLGRAVVRATTPDPAFGVLDAQALAAGLVRGENAAQATVLRVGGLGPRPEDQAEVVATATAPWDPDAELVEAFYAVYARAVAAERDWERRAPAAETLSPKRMVAFWEASLKGERDPYGRPLHLSVLPDDLLALVDPRVVASDGTRLPEDVENWDAYVAKEAP